MGDRAFELTIRKNTKITTYGQYEACQVINELIVPKIAFVNLGSTHGYIRKYILCYIGIHSISYSLLSLTLEIDHWCKDIPQNLVKGDFIRIKGEISRTSNPMHLRVEKFIDMDLITTTPRATLNQLLAGYKQLPQAPKREQDNNENKNEEPCVKVINYFFYKLTCKFALEVWNFFFFGDSFNLYFFFFLILTMK